MSEIVRVKYVENIQQRVLSVFWDTSEDAFNNILLMTAKVPGAIVKKKKDNVIHIVDTDTSQNGLIITKTTFILKPLNYLVTEDSRWIRVEDPQSFERDYTMFEEGLTKKWEDK